MSSASEGPLTAVSDQKESTVSQTVRKPRVNLMIQGYLSGRVVGARRVGITNIALKLTSLILVLTCSHALVTVTHRTTDDTQITRMDKKTKQKVNNIHKTRNHGDRDPDGQKTRTARADTIKDR